MFFFYHTWLIVYTRIGQAGSSEQFPVLYIKEHTWWERSDKGRNTFLMFPSLMSHVESVLPGNPEKITNFICLSYFVLHCFITKKRISWKKRTAESLNFTEHLMCVCENITHLKNGKITFARKRILLSLLPFSDPFFGKINKIGLEMTQARSHNTKLVSKTIQQNIQISEYRKILNASILGSSNYRRKTKRCRKVPN